MQHLVTYLLGVKCRTGQEAEKGGRRWVQRQENRKSRVFSGVPLSSVQDSIRAFPMRPGRKPLARSAMTGSHPLISTTLLEASPAEQP
jgi:hypothetical protein